MVEIRDILPMFGFALSILDTLRIVWVLYGVQLRSIIYEIGWKYLSHTMILKIAVIVLSVVAIVLASIVVGGVLIIGQVLENDPNIHSEIRQWLGAEGGSDLGQNSQEEVSSSSPVSAMEQGIIVSIVGNSGQNSYNPNPSEIKVGDTVTWINNDSSPHTVTSSSDEGNITFDSDVLRRGETFSFTFDQEGEYPYLCTLHPSMIGTVVVVTA
jgi:plastocyanin